MKQRIHQRLGHGLLAILLISGGTMLGTGTMSEKEGLISYKKGSKVTKAAALCALASGAYLLYSPNSVIDFSFLTAHSAHLLGKAIGTLLIGAGAGHLALNRLKKINYRPNVRYIGPQDIEGLKAAMCWKDGKSYITLYLHGWDWGHVPYGDWAYHEKHIGTLPGVAATVNFPEAGAASFMRYLFTSSLGQRPDALVAIYALKTINEELYPDVINIYGFSRGTAAAVNTEAILADTSDKYDADLQRIGVTPEIRAELLEKIRRGALILNTPMGNGNDAIKRHVAWIPQWIKLAATWAASNYNPAGPHLEESANHINSPGRKAFLYFEQDDNMTGNKAANKKLCNAFMRNNPETTTIIEGADGDSWGFGGHAHHLTGGKTFVHALNLFLKEHGYPYTPDAFIRPTLAF